MLTIKINNILFLTYNQIKILILLSYFYLNIYQAFAGNQFLTALTQSKIELRNKNVSKENLNKTLVRVVQLINKLQAPRINHNGELIDFKKCCANDNCNDYYEFIKILKSIFSEINDQHTNITFNNLNSSLLPVVTDVIGNLSSDIIGSPVFPIINSKGHSDLVYIVKENGMPQLFKVKEVRNSLLKNSYNLIENSVDSLLRKSEIENLDNLTILLEDLNSHKIETINVKYDKMVKYSSNRSFFNKYMNPDFGKIIDSVSMFQCTVILEGSDYNVGGCLTKDRRLQIWIRNWMESSDNEITSKITKFLESNPSNLPVILDLSGNRGGDPKLIINFICHFGTKNIISYLDKIVIKRPVMNRENFELNEMNIGEINRDLVDGTIQNEDFKILERYNIDPQLCETFQNSNPNKNIKWTIVTNGNELSSTEQLLYFLKQDKSSKFTIIGHKTMGASGHPIHFDIPEAEINFNLSVARLFDSNINKFIIEGQGVQPNIEMKIDQTETFEKRVQYLFYQTPYNIDELIPFELKQAELVL